MKRILAAFMMLAALAAPLLSVPGTASAQAYMTVSVGYPPPPLPWYPQPACPGTGYLWTPGYWSWGPYGYYWVPGTWVLAPAVGLFWTPGYWAWDGGYYWWHSGYWGPSVGFYGDIDYGYGYPGYGYTGGYWDNDDFYYNRTVTNVDVTYIHTYSQPVDNPGPPESRISYNGGQGGIRVRATAAQLEYAQAQHVPPTAMQLHQERLALDNPAQRFTVNQGRPQIAATTRPGEFRGAGVVRMNTQQDGYVYRGKHVPLAPEYRSAAPTVREPQWRMGTPYMNGYRQPARPEMHNLRAPMRVMPVRPTPAPAERTKIHQPQSQAMVYGNVYVNAPQASVRTQNDGWNTHRSYTPPPAQFRSAPVRQPSWSAPHLQARMQNNVWNMNRNAMPRPEQFRSAPVVHASWSAPRFQVRTPSRGPGGNGHGNHGHPGR
jgi:hypothetical protein